MARSRAVADATAVLDSISELFIASDREWRVTYINRRARQYLHVLGMRPSAVIGQVLWDALPFLQGTPFHTTALRALARGTELEVEAQLAPLDRWFSSRIVPTPEGSVSYSRDVTDRHLAEDAARSNAELMRAVVNGTTDAIFAKDHAGRYIMANDATAQVMGRRPEDVIGLRDVDLFPADVARRLMEHDQGVLEDGEPRTYEETLPGAGGPRVFQAKKTAFLDARGQRCGVLGIAREVTEQRIVEEEIRRLNRTLEDRVAELRTLLDVIPVGIGVATDAEARDIRANPAFAEMLGIEPGTNPSLTGPAAPLMRYRVMHDGRELQPEELPIQRAARGSRIAGEEIDIVRPDGSRSVLLCHASPLFDDRGEPRGAVAAFLDVTRRLREERAQRVLSDASALLNSSLDLEATLSAIAHMAVPRFADACFVDLFQEGELERVEIACEDPDRRALLLRIARPHSPALQGEDHSIARAVRTGQPVLAREVTGESRRKAARSPEHLEFLEAVAADSLISAPMVALGEVLGALTFCFIGSGRRYDEADVAVARELADRAAMAVVNARLYRAARSELARRARAEADVARWGHIFRHAGWGVAIASIDGTRFEAVNPAFARMHGHDDPDALVGRPLDLVTAPDSRHLITRNALAARERGRVVFETRHVTADGVTFPVLVDLTAVRSDDGTLLCLAANVQDLTERERGEAQVRQAQKMEALGRLAGGVAHDFNNVLMIIIGFADFLCASMEPADPRRVDAEEIRKAAERAAALTRQLLAFGRPRLSQRQAVDVNAVVRDMELMLRSMLGEHIRLETALQPGRVGMDSDRGEVEQVLMNLALNARDAMPDGGRITIATRTVAFERDEGYRATGIDLAPGEYVMLSVADTGHGMDPGTRARIFEPFFSTRRSAQNSGLGLAVVYGIVTQNGGHIWVESEPGQGTTFSLCFPLGGADARDVISGEMLAVRGGSETLLVVEDEDTVRALTLRVLADAGYAVVAARHGEEALELIRQMPIDLVISDVVMPGMGGAELAERLATERPGLPLVFMSGYTGDDVARQGLGSAEERFLQKPFAAESLLHKVRELLDAALSPTQTEKR
jgi:PAS domain S-box-containing protein